MKTKATKWLTLLLAGLMLLGTATACGESSDNTDDSAATTETAAAAESESVDLAAEALENIGDVDFGGKEFGILYAGGFKSEIVEEEDAAEGASENNLVISEAVHARNVSVEERCKVDLQFVPKDDILSAVRNEASASTGEFYLIDATLRDTATTSPSAASCATGWTWVWSWRAPGGTAEPPTSCSTDVSTSCPAPTTSATTT